ncbi:PD-(D/E)XK nuclease-like domain-containing protein [Thalassotalea piscium]|uniref:Exodeoxyribonuclease VIII n=1 Tax=Thalassotalea piscium TaxID=1230533 RepID=A0A7X0NGZ1_9GAMM|nr:PD-(D/E)XK nuclease-like domain-containing protein [Thalassotalea piscium]MBB6543126.1 exodeoxyribonuclease VIII [Thalassotalea piscium]
MSLAIETSTPQWFETIQPAYINGQPTYLDENGELIEGIYTDLENDVYHSLDAFSSSLVKELIKNTPAHVFRQYLSGIERKRTLSLTRTLDTGTLGHELILEPNGFFNRYFRLPLAKEYENALSTATQLKAKCTELSLKTSGSKPELITRLTEHDPKILIFDVILEKLIIKHAGDKAFKLAQKQVELKNASSIIRAFELPIVQKEALKKPIDGLVWDDAQRILATFKKHRRAPRFINNGYAELTVIARCPVTGLMLKTKFDYINKQALASDVKTTRSTNPIKFALQCRDLRYDVQEAFYKYVANLAGVPVKIFGFISIEYADADICEVFEISKRRQMLAHADMTKGLQVLADCLDTNDWYGYSKHDEIMVIDF